MPGIPAAGRLRQDCGEFKISLDYTVSTKSLRIMYEVLSQSSRPNTELQQPPGADWKNGGSEELQPQLLPISFLQSLNQLRAQGAQELMF